MTIMTKRLTDLFLLLTLLLGLFSCNATRETKIVTKKISDKELRERLIQEHGKEFKYFYSKVSVDYESSKLNQSFKSSLKMTVDSAFSGTISVARIIIANFLASKDSLKATNKQNKCYFTEHISFISSIMGVELEYDFFENMLLGKPVGFDEGMKYKQLKDKNGEYYILSSHKKREFKKLEKDKINLENEKNDVIYLKYYFSPDSLALVKQIIEIPVDSFSVTINFVEKIKEDGRDVPEYTTVVIDHPKETIKVGISYNKQIINKRKAHVFSVPEQYENCNN